MVGGECVSVMWALGCVSMSASALCVSDLGMFVLLYSQVSVATCSLYVCVCVVCLGFCVIVYVWVHVCHMSYMELLFFSGVLSVAYLGGVCEHECSRRVCAPAIWSVTSIWVPVGARSWAKSSLQTHSSIIDGSRWGGVSLIPRAEAQVPRLSPSPLLRVTRVTLLAPGQQKEERTSVEGSTHLPFLRPCRVPVGSEAARGDVEWEDICRPGSGGA